MAEGDAQRQDRIKRRDDLIALGVDPYGQRFDNVDAAAAIREKAAPLKLEPGEKSEQTARVAGRIMLARMMGKLAFLTIRDGSGKIQIAFSKQDFGAERWPIVKKLQLGDIIGVDGIVGSTKTGELTVWASELTVLCKALRPPPEKFHGLTDVDLRYRRRYVDLFTNPDVRDTFRQRSAIIQAIRGCLIDHDYLEVDTPVLQPIYGGAAARPFLTHHNTLDMQLYLRISPELYLKRLLVGGMERVFEISRNFRNEGISTKHNPEFTMIELYEAYADYRVMMERVEQMFAAGFEVSTKSALPARLAAMEAEIERIRAELVSEEDLFVARGALADGAVFPLCRSWGDRSASSSALHSPLRLHRWARGLSSPRQSDTPGAPAAALRCRSSWARRDRARRGPRESSRLRR